MTALAMTAEPAAAGDAPVLRIAILADDPLTRAGLAALLAAEPGCQVVGQAPAADGLPALLDLYRPDAVLWDLGWDPSHTPAAGGRSALERLADLETPQQALVLLLSDAAQAAAVWAAGGRAMLLRDTPPQTIITALAAAVAHLVVLDPDLAAAIGRSLPPSGRSSGALTEALTPRELEVLRCLAEGLANKDIARQLVISEHTVKFHLNAILAKLGAQSRTDAVIRATRLGLVAL